MGVIKNIIVTTSNPIKITKLDDGTKIKLDLRSTTEWPSYFSRSYDDRLIDLVSRTSKLEGNTFLDIGANIGFYTARVSRRLSPEQKIFAFEPVKSNAERLRENIEINDLKGVSVFEFALADANGHFDIVLREDFEGGASTGNASLAISEEADGKFRKERIEMLRYDDFDAGNGHPAVGVIKIDVEGHEDLFFAGAQNMLGRDLPIIFSEINNWYFEKREKSSGDLFSASLPKGYQAYGIKESASGIELFHIPFRDLAELKGMHNVVLCPKEKLENLMTVTSELG